MNLINRTLQFELELLNLEKNWSRQGQFYTMNADTNYGGKNSPVDLITDILEPLETQILGSKAQKFEANFSKTDNNENIITEIEPWQNPKKLIPEISADYAESERRYFAELIDNLERFLSKFPAANALTTNKVSTNLWDPAHKTTALPYSVCPGLNITVNQPIISSDIPLALQQDDENHRGIASNILSENQAFLEKTSYENDCYLTISNETQNTKTGEKSLRQCEYNRTQGIADKRNTFQKNQKKARLKREYQANKYGLDYFESFAGYVEESFGAMLHLSNCYTDPARPKL